MRYERKVAKALADMEHQWLKRNAWFEYEEKDNAKKKLCSPDILALHDGTLYIIEVKRSALVAAYDKLDTLYAPVVRLAFPSATSIKTVQVFKYLTSATLIYRPVKALPEIFNARNPEQFGVHWLG